MIIETYEFGKYQIIKINDEKNAISDLSQFEDLINGFIDRGKHFIAVSFCDASYIYSGAIQILISCHKRISENKGELCIIEPNPSLYEILENLNINKIINIYSSEKYLSI